MRLIKAPFSGALGEALTLEDGAHLDDYKGCRGKHAYKGCRGKHVYKGCGGNHAYKGCMGKHDY